MPADRRKNKPECRRRNAEQIIKDLQSNVLADMEVRQIFTIEDGLISLYEIGETETIQEMIQKNKAANEQ